MIVKNSIFKILKVSSYLIWGTVIGLLFLLCMFSKDYIDNQQINGYITVIWIFIGFLIFVWLPVAIFYANYLLHTTRKKYIIELNRKSIDYYEDMTYKKIEFKDIIQIKKIEHINRKTEINNPTNFWDRLENSIRKKQLKMPWSGFSYMKIFGKDGDLIILTSLMTNYENLPFDNVETEYVKFPFIK